MLKSGLVNKTRRCKKKEEENHAKDAKDAEGRKRSADYAN